MYRYSLSYLWVFVLLTALLFCVGPANSAPSYNTGGNEVKKSVIRVKDGESIQKAINEAPRGARIEVFGKHREQILITKDDIELIGKDAILIAPSPYQENRCTGLSKVYISPGVDGADTNTGICIYGKLDLNNTYNQFEGHKKVKTVHSPVKNVRISGFEIVGFDGQNIAVYGGKDVTISHNKLKQGGRYGFIAVGSKGTEASNNIVIGSSPVSLNNGAIALCMDDLSSAQFSNNNVSDYFIGLCTQTNGGINRGNNVHGCCLGNVIDPGIKDVKTIDNHFYDWNPKCDAYAAAGISLLGSINAIVKGNKIDNIITGKQTGAGLYLGDIFGVQNQGNIIKKNVFGKNDVDIFDDSKGKNDIRDNKCDLAARGPVPGTPAPEYCK